jgi:glycosyltransferase involved in cell wall biosynthesis
MRKQRVLIISYYWPPYTGSGVQRWLKFAKYLPEFGWEPVVYTPESPEYGLQDESFLKEIPDACTVIKRPIWEPYKLLNLFKGKSKQSNIGLVKSNASKGLKDKVLNWIRGNIFIPDPRVFWVRPSVRFLTQYLKANPVDVIITTGPPHSMHLIGLGLKQKLGITWLADFRDPWSKLDFLDQFMVTAWSRKRYENFESKVLKHADAVLGTSHSMKDFLQDFDHQKFYTITNGYDESDFDNIPNVQPEKFIISHTGLLNENRNPSNLWKVLNELCEENEAFSNELEIQLTGLVDSNVVAIIQAYPLLKARLKLQAYQPHSEVIRQNAKAAVLLMLINNTHNANANIPGKLFEYLAVKRPILSIGKKSADASKIVEACHAGFALEYDATTELKAALLQLFEAYQSQSNNNKAFKNIEQYSRKALTKKLAELLNNTSPKA